MVSIGIMNEVLVGLERERRDERGEGGGIPT